MFYNEQQKDASTSYVENVNHDICKKYLITAWKHLLKKQGLEIEQTLNTFGQNRTAEIGHLCQTCSAILAEHSLVCRTMVQQKKILKNRVRSIASLKGLNKTN